MPLSLEENGAILHGVLCLLVLSIFFPIYAIIYGLFIRKDNQAYGDVTLIIIGWAILVGMVICVFAVVGLAA